MKLYILLTAVLLSFSAASDEVAKGIDINIKLLKCLDEKIPNSAIKDPENRTAKSLFLIPSIIENTMKTTTSDESKSQFLLTMKYCAKEIYAFKAWVETQTDKE